MNTNPDDRSIGIDCLRAFSILWVVTYHFVPHPIFHYGLYGVALFFIISGYCIGYSVRSSSSAWDFYAKRIGRLMPALVVCGAITITAKHLFPSLVPADRVVPWSSIAVTPLVMPSLNIFRFNLLPPDGAYWSLFIEFQFYALCAAILLVGGRRYLIQAVCLWCILRFCWSDAAKPYSNDFFPFFIAGLSVAAYMAGDRRLALAGLAIAGAVDFLHLHFSYQQPSMPITLTRTASLWVGAAIVFAVAHCSAPRWLKPVAFVGLVSYPMYLLHQDLGNMFLAWVGVPYSDRLETMLFRLLVLPPLVILAGTAIFYLIERPSIRPLTSFLRRWNFNKLVGMQKGD